MRSVTLVWPGGEHLFAFRIGELEALQSSTNSGPGEVLGRLYACMPPNNPLLGPWRISDVLDTVRLGLIGGGMDQAEARNLVKSVVEREGPVALLPAACDALLTALELPEDSPKKEAGEAMPPRSGNSEN